MRVKSNLDEILYHKIIEALIRGEYSIGQKILLNDLCEKFEVSRTPIIQAVKMLNKDGVLTIMTNGRVYVPEYEYDTVKQTCEARILLESYGLKQLFAEQDEDVFCQRLELIRTAAAQCERYLMENRNVELAMADLHFHKMILNGTGNEILQELYTGVQGRFIVVNYLARPFKERDFKGTIKDHELLVEYISSRQKEAAIAKLKDHINGVIVKYNK
ncbi:MAG: GntR family transcriptional regulator [Lachnospiraceae bacterium]